MNKIYKAIKIIILFIILYFIFLFGNAIYMLTKGHKVDVLINSNANWFITDTCKTKLDSISTKYYTKKDILYNFHYKLDNKRFFVRVWIINDLQLIKFSSLKTNLNSNLENEIEPKEYEILNNRGDFSIVVKYDYDFNNGFNLNFPKSDSSVFFENKPNLKYVYGKFDYITITNGKKEEQIVFRNMHSYNYTAFFVFRKNKKNYLALVHSDFYFSKDIAKIFSFYK